MICTYGRLEIQFQHLREPFDDLGLRAEMLHRLNRLPGIAIPEDAIARRPSIALALLADDRSALEGLKATLECDVFVTVWRPSQLTTDGRPRPASSRARSTSAAMPRIEVATSATVTNSRTPITSGRVSTSTGRRFRPASA